MTKSIKEIFGFLSYQTFNPEIFKHNLKDCIDQEHLDVNSAHNFSGNITQKGSTLLGEAARCLNIEAVRILLQDFGCDPNALTQGEGKQIWTPVYWALYGSASCGMAELQARLSILDLLRNSSANIEILVTTSEYNPSCNSLIEYALTSPVANAAMLHGVAPVSTNASHRNAQSFTVSNKHKAILQEIKEFIEKNPAEYLYATLHPESEKIVLPTVSAKDTAKASAFTMLKNGTPPKRGDIYTKNALELLNQLAQDLKSDPSLLLKVTLHKDTKAAVQDSLDALETNFEQIEAESYKLLTHKGVDSSINGSYTDNATKAIRKLAAELHTTPRLLLYYTLDGNTAAELNKELVKTHHTDLHAIRKTAHENLEAGAAPKEEGAEGYATNAKASLDKIASDMKDNPLKFLHVQLHADSKSAVSQWLADNSSSIDSIKSKADAKLKDGGNLIGDNGLLTDNGKEAIVELAKALKGDPALWLHITLHADAIKPLSECLIEEESSIDNIKKAAVEILCHGEDSYTEGKYTPNTLEALGVIKDLLSNSPKEWLFMNLENSTKAVLVQLGLDIAKVEAGARGHIEHGGSALSSGSVHTSNANAIIISLVDKYIRDSKIPTTACFSKDVIEKVYARLYEQGRSDLDSQVKRDYSDDLEAAKGEMVEVHATTASSVSSVATPVKHAQESSTVLGWVWNSFGFFSQEANKEQVFTVGEHATEEDSA